MARTCIQPTVHPSRLLFAQDRTGQNRTRQDTSVRAVGRLLHKVCGVPCAAHAPCTCERDELPVRLRSDKTMASRLRPLHGMIVFPRRATSTGAWVFGCVLSWVVILVMPFWRTRSSLVQILVSKVQWNRINFLSPAVASPPVGAGTTASGQQLRGGQQVRQLPWPMAAARYRVLIGLPSVEIPYSMIGSIGAARREDTSWTLTSHPGLPVERPNHHQDPHCYSPPHHGRRRECR